MRQGKPTQAGAWQFFMPNNDLDVTTEKMMETFAVVARHNGNCAAAARELELVPDTVRHWKRKNVELYNKIAKANLETVRQATADKHLAIAAEATDVESEVIGLVRQRLANPDKIETRDLTTIGRNLATEAGIHTDKATDMLGLKDKSVTAIQVNLNMGEMVRSMATKGTKFYDSEGREIDPEAIESSTNTENGE